MAKKAASGSSAKSTKKSTSASAAAKQSPKTEVSSAAPSVSSSARKTTTVRRVAAPGFLERFNRDVTVRALIGEIVGTFVLASIAILSGEGLYVGLTLMVLVLGFGAISGAHLNPAITLSQWSIRRLPGLAVPFYWAAQFLGAFAALVVQYLYSGKQLDLTLHSFGAFDARIFFAELIGTFIFAYIVTTLAQRSHSEGVRAAGIGIGLTIGIVLGTSMIAAAISGSTATTKADDLLATQKVVGVNVNPAIAAVITEKDNSQNGYSQQPATPSKPVSRFTTETVLGPLVGAVLGANLYALISRRDK